MTETQAPYMTDGDAALDRAMTVDGVLDEAITTEGLAQPKRLGDVLGLDHDPAGRVHVADLAAAGVEFTIESAVEQVGQFGQFLIVNVEVGGEQRHFLTSHKAILQKLRAVAADDLPVVATIRKRQSRSGYSYFDIG